MQASKSRFHEGGLFCRLTWLLGAHAQLGFWLLLNFVLVLFVEQLFSCPPQLTALEHRKTFRNDRDSVLEHVFAHVFEEV